MGRRMLHGASEVADYAPLIRHTSCELFRRNTIRHRDASATIPIYAYTGLPDREPGATGGSNSERAKRAKSVAADDEVIGLRLVDRAKVSV